jgi:hypothetical protein
MIFVRFDFGESVTASTVMPPIENGDPVVATLDMKSSR